MSGDSPYDWLGPSTGVRAEYTYQDRKTSRGIRQNNLHNAMVMGLQSNQVNRDTWELKETYSNNDRTTQVITGNFDRSWLKNRKETWTQLLNGPDGRQPVPIGVNNNPGF
jgi:hypothetical protein